MTFILKPNPIYDVYEGEYPVAWDKMNPVPVLAILKASGKFLDEVRREDYKVREYAEQCRLLGIKIGLYHFLLPNDITEQAQLFVSVWRSLGGASIRPIVDIEVDKPYLDSHGIGQKVWADQIKAWMDYVETALGVRPIIYTSIRYWPFTYSKDSLGNLVPPAWAKGYDVWVAWYPTNPDDFSWIPSSMIPKGFNREVMWQYNDKGRSNGFLANDLNVASPEFLQEIQADISSKPKGVVCLFEKKDIDLKVTPLKIIYPLKSALEQAQEYGWEGAINCGAGFDYVDSDNAALITNRSPFIEIDGQSVFYIRQIIKDGIVITDRDSQTAPWTMLGWDELNWYFAVSYGLEGSSDALTERQAAEWLLSFGAKNCILFDSGRSSQISSNGRMVYWPYESQNEKVPQCLGWKIKSFQTGGSMKKGTQLSGYTNVKPMDGIGTTYQLQVNDSVYGNFSSTGSDIIDIQNVHRANGDIVPLGKSYKAAITNSMKVEDVTSEPTGVPPVSSSSEWPLEITVESIFKDVNGNVLASYSGIQKRK